MDKNSIERYGKMKIIPIVPIVATIYLVGVVVFIFVLDGENGIDELFCGFFWPLMIVPIMKMITSKLSLPPLKNVPVYIKIAIQNCTESYKENLMKINDVTIENREKRGRNDS